MGAAKTSPERPEGVVWIQDTLAVVPQWTAEPDPEAVRAAVKELALFRIPPTQSINVVYLTQGGFSRVYIVRIGEDLDELVMRVSLPIEPTWKTLSEVATVEWVRKNTSLPVPRILTHEVNRDNCLGFEWILMSKVPGSTLADAWRSMDFPAKKCLVQQLANFSSSLFKKQLRGIGNIYPASESNPKCQNGRDSDQPAVRRIVSTDFFWGDRVWNPPGNSVSRGPFRSSKAWLEARLSMAEHDHHCTISRCADKEDLTKKGRSQVKRAVRVLGVIRRLKALIHSDLDLFPCCSKQNEAEPSMLCHDDLGWRNILVDKSGALTGVIDWECVSALPLWKACDYPAFLKAETSHIEPGKAWYRDDEDSQKAYWHHMRRYELTKLRQYFLDEMQRLEPGWVEVFVASEWLRDLELVIQFCSEVDSVNVINQWIDGVIGKSDPFSYFKRFYD